MSLMGHEPGRTSQGHSGWCCQSSSFGELTGFLDLMLTWFSSDSQPLLNHFLSGQDSKNFFSPPKHSCAGQVEKVKACSWEWLPAVQEGGLGFLDPRPLYSIVAADAGVCLEHCSSGPSPGEDQKPPQPTGSSCPLPHPAPWHILEEGLLSARAVHPQIC